jgi:hypothetical protein
MSSLNNGPAHTPEESAVSIIKIFLIMLAFIIGILFFGRFLF